MHAQGLVYFRYKATTQGKAAPAARWWASRWKKSVAAGFLRLSPIIYEDFLAVRAAGIFQSNLGSPPRARHSYDVASSRVAFEAALGASVHDELKFYAETEATSLRDALAALGR